MKFNRNANNCMEFKLRASHAVASLNRHSICRSSRTVCVNLNSIRPLLDPQARLLLPPLHYFPDSASAHLLPIPFFPTDVPPLDVLADTPSFVKHGDVGRGEQDAVRHGQREAHVPPCQGGFYKDRVRRNERAAGAVEVFVDVRNVVLVYGQFSVRWFVIRIVSRDEGWWS